jgi:hypothetical protein
VTSEEIKKVPLVAQASNIEEQTIEALKISGILEHGIWLKEIAYQLAVMNERAEQPRSTWAWSGSIMPPESFPDAQKGQNK